MAALLLLALPVSIHAQPRFPEPDSRTDIGDWVVECYGVGPKARCQVYQRILMNKGTSIAMVATFAYKPAGNEELAYQIAVPLGVEVSKPALMALGPDYAIALPISRCTQQGCLLEGTISGDALDRLLAAKTASITVVNPNAGNFQIPMSLDGFARSLASIAPPSTNASEPITSRSGEEAAQESGEIRSVLPSPTEGVDDQLWPVTGSQRRQQEIPADE